VSAIQEASSPPACTFTIGGFEVPLSNNTGATTVPESLQEAVDAASTDNRFINQTAILLEQLDDAGLLIDTFQETIEGILDQGLAGIGFEFVRA
jgi:hypothetical protein